jgi:D-threo-aldose 1-dehydrogenase
MTELTLARRPLPGTSLTVSELGFGASQIGNFGRPITPEQAAEAVGAAWLRGIRYFDTAPHYGLGLSERRLGEALRTKPRSEYVVSTKVGQLLVPNASPTGSDLTAGGFAVPDDQRRVLDYSAAGVVRSLETSLDRLGLDRVDIVLVHDPDDHVDQTIKEAIPALVALRDQGIVGAVGVGMNQWQAPLHILEASDVDVIMIAGRWTLLDHSARELLDACAGRKVAVLVAAPYNSGLLAHDRPPDGAHFDYATAPSPLLERARLLARACSHRGVPLPAAALRFPLRHPAVASVVAGLRSREEVGASVDRLNTAVPSTLWAELNRI